MPLNRVLLIGGTGNLGSLILKHLQASKTKFAVSVLARRSSNQKNYPSGVSVVDIDDDYPAEQLREAFGSADVVISAISMAGMHHQQKFIDACIEAKVQRYIPTEFGLDDLPQWLLDFRPEFKTKHDVRDYLASKEATGLSWTSICCNLFFEMGIEIGLFQINLNEKKAILLDNGTTQWPVTTMDTAALAVVRVIEMAESTANRILRIQDFMTSQKEIFDELEKRVGGWKAEHCGLEPWVEEAKEKVKQGHHRELGKLTFAVAQQAGDWSQSDNYANTLLHLPTKTFKKEMEAVIDTLQAKQ